MSILKREKVVLVEWVDAAGDGGWNPRKVDENWEPIKVTSVGLLIHRCKNRIVLAGALCGSKDETSVTQVIPGGWVKKYKVLAELKPRKKRK